MENYEDFATLYAKPFSKNATESKVVDLFAPYGRVLGVEMRKDDTGSFRGSVFVTFADATCARSALSNPPLQLGSSSDRLLVMLRPDYDRKVGTGLGSGRGGAGKPSNGKTPVTKSPHAATARYASGNDSSSGQKRGRGENPPAGSGGGGYQPQPSQQMWSPSGALSGGGYDAAAGAPGGGGQLTHWRGLAEERERRIKELEELLKTEREAREVATSRTNQAVSDADDAQMRERAATSRLLAREAEVGCLKGEVGSLRTGMAVRLEQLHIQYKARIHELEMSVQQLKDSNLTLKHRLQRGSAPPAKPAEAGQGSKVDELLGDDDDDEL